MKTKVLSIILGASLWGAVSLAFAAEYDFQDPKGVNNVVFMLDAPLESINGTATGISGTVEFDWENPAATSGKIVVQSESMHVGNPKMKDHLHGGKWMDVNKHPEIVFEIESLSDVVKDGNRIQGSASGFLTVKGTRKAKSVDVSMTYLEGQLGKRFPKKEGDLLVVRSNFSISREEFGINPGKLEEKVSDEVVINLSLAGGAEK